MDTEPAYISLDGDKLHVDPYLDDTIRKLYKSRNCCLRKLATSCTAIQQLCDTGNIFLVSKTKNKSIGDDDIVGEADRMDNLINVIIKHKSTKFSK